MQSLNFTKQYLTTNILILQDVFAVAQIKMCILCSNLFHKAHSWVFVFYETKRMFNLCHKILFLINYSGVFDCIRILLQIFRSQLSLMLSISLLFIVIFYSFTSVFVTVFKIIYVFKCIIFIILLCCSLYLL